jgi:hypothetical protein
VFGKDALSILRWVHGGYLKSVWQRCTLDLEMGAWRILEERLARCTLDLEMGAWRILEECLAKMHSRS